MTVDGMPILKQLTQTPGLATWMDQKIFTILCIMFCLVWFFKSSQQLFSHVGTGLLFWTSTKQRIKCLAHGSNIVYLHLCSPLYLHQYWCCWYFENTIDTLPVLKIRTAIKNELSYFSTKTYVASGQKNCFNEKILWAPKTNVKFDGSKNIHNWPLSHCYLP